MMNLRILVPRLADIHGTTTFGAPSEISGYARKAEKVTVNSDRCNAEELGTTGTVEKGHRWDCWQSPGDSLHTTWCFAHGFARTHPLMGTALL